MMLPNPKVLHKSFTLVNVSSDDTYFGIRNNRDFIFQLLFSKKKKKKTTLYPIKKFIYVFRTYVFMYIFNLFCGVIVTLFF